ncbi:16S rRNA (adenine(1518)-N(6)/adenine(1519)-N(6))-dimethyltransferase RsmA [Riemerella columbipharyngis]|uniref:Ribosomal RNA small subunit methyltransferase A n=1 Tax=Riemerella columbipharyngis TaxID=1071918 RepID=A0A1G7FSI1_9FLAO|nr:16S rRNA (adenine(1518)-N(6)/adenine(1519)-N(6))-dimethyltransferase RsmA [Riemerella columbipharyngis]SDE78856.1 16S rRNA (adenine1518-N6/adenine1519-N6)-dimethyltransferase [Riemerella columbipharyngis]
MIVKAKKHLGQHFLHDENIAQKIVASLDGTHYPNVLEVGPGTGVLTKYLLDRSVTLSLAEIDEESIAYLKETYPPITEETFVGDFLRLDIEGNFDSEVGVIGNFPYNISSQILFKIIDNYRKIPEMVGMFQKEVAERTAAKPRQKSYGILSVLVQAYYDVEYLFTVNENVFTPPPKVKSGVIKLTRNPKEALTGIEDLFKKIVKAGFNQRRKKLSNALKIMRIPQSMASHPFLDCRAEELNVEDFIQFSIEWRNSCEG